MEEQTAHLLWASQKVINENQQSINSQLQHALQRIHTSFTELLAKVDELEKTIEALKNRELH